MNPPSLLLWKYVVLWHLAIDRNKYIVNIKCPLFNKETLSEIAKKIIESVGDTISGYRIFRKPGLLSFNNFCLEKGNWSTIEYIQSWVYLLSYSQINFDNTVQRIVKSILKYSHRFNIDPVNITDELWEELWINDFILYAEVRKQITYGNSNATLEDVEELYLTLKDAILNAKTNSRNLDEWLDGLHKIIPHLMYGVLISSINHNEAKKYNRFFEEAKADVLAVYGVCLQEVISNNPLTFSQYYLPNREINKDKYFNELRYNYNSRICFPKFWYVFAKECFEDDSLILKDSSKNNNIDGLSTVGKSCHISLFHTKLDLEYICTGEIPKSVRKSVHLRSQ